MVTLRTLLTAIVVPSLVLVSAAVPARAPADPEVVLTASCSYAAQVLNLTNWKLQLPTAKPDGSPGVQEIKQPQLKTYRNPPYFFAQSNCDGVGFMAPVNGATTTGSSYPRSELREMTNNGQDQMAFSSTVGTHKFNVLLAFNTLPKVKPHLVGVQVHGGTFDASAFRLEGKNLWITNGDNAHWYLVTNNYSLNTRFLAGYEVGGGQIKAFVNGRQVTSFPSTFTTGYFKTGAYTQANCTNSTPCNSTNFGKTFVYAMSATHQVTAMQRLSGAVRDMLGMS